MLRGLSSGATRSWRNFRMRLLCCGSSLARSRSTGAESSILQAMPLHCNFERDSLFIAAADAVQSTLGEIHVLDAVEGLEGGLADTESFGAGCAARECFSAFFDGLGKPNGQHGTSLYKDSTDANQ